MSILTDDQDFYAHNSNELLGTDHKPNFAQYLFSRFEMHGCLPQDGSVTLDDVMHEMNRGDVVVAEGDMRVHLEDADGPRTHPFCSGSFSDIAIRRWNGTLLSYCAFGGRFSTVEPCEITADALVSVVEPLQLDTPLLLARAARAVEQGKKALRLTIDHNVPVDGNGLLKKLRVLRSLVAVRIVLIYCNETPLIDIAALGDLHGASLVVRNPSIEWWEENRAPFAGLERGADRRIRVWFEMTPGSSSSQLALAADMLDSGVRVILTMAEGAWTRAQDEANMAVFAAMVLNGRSGALQSNGPMLRILRQIAGLNQRKVAEVWF